MSPQFWMLILWLNDIFLLLLYIFHEYYFRGVAPSGLSSRLVYAVQGFTPLPGGCRPFRTQGFRILGMRFSSRHYNRLPYSFNSQRFTTKASKHHITKPRKGWYPPGRGVNPCETDTLRTMKPQRGVTHKDATLFKIWITRTMIVGNDTIK